MIEIQKIDESFLKIHCEDDIARELSSFFTFKVPNHEFTPAFRRKKWDGKIRLFNMAARTIYTGLLDYVEKFFSDRNYKYTTKFESAINTFDLEYVKSWISNQPL